MFPPCIEATEDNVTKQISASASPNEVTVLKQIEFWELKSDWWLK
jgi:hypothetical protein